MPARPFEGAGTQRERNTIELGCILQRLFSTFPNSWPGVGLLLLRLCLGIALLNFAPETTFFTQELIAIVGGIFLIAGLWTPATGALVALDEVWVVLMSYSPPREDTWIRMFLAMLAVSVAMLGPGAWSIDARLFGRKRFDIDRTKSRR